MELISITPKGAYEWMYEQPMAMLLAHLASDEEYVSFANDPKNKNVYKIVDNSIVELGESVTLKTILDAAKKLNANEIILRDAYPNGPKTIQRVQEDMAYLRENNLIGKYNLMAVCHGETKEEFEETFKFLNSIPELTCIGIPKVLSRWVGDRKELFDIWKNTDKEIHYLGSWYSLSELQRLPKEVRNRIRSCDTCLPSLLVIQNKDLWEDREGTINLSQTYPELVKDKYDEMIKQYNTYMEENN